MAGKVDVRPNRFDRHSYLNLETFKRSGHGVRTPVWFVQDGPTLFVRTGATSGKVKRIRNNSRVRLVPSDAQGNPRGDWMEAGARLVEGEEAQRVSRLATRKYGAMKVAFDLIHQLRGDRWATIRIDLAPEEGR
jgi:uncharacterized protein